MSIVITGNGLVGSAFDRYDVIRISSQQYDLRNYDACLKMMDDLKPTKIIHTAAKIGGVLFNMRAPAEFFTDNLLINTNLLHTAHIRGVEKVISLLSTCIFPGKIDYPLTEEKIHLGPPDVSNLSYAYAKRMLDIGSKAYNLQYGSQFFCAVPTNIYGAHDQFHLEHSHVAPALIRKFYEAKLYQHPTVEIWGTGQAKREFVFSEDLADILMMMLDNYTDVEPMIITTSEEITIKELAEMVKGIVGYTGEIFWNPDKPEGQFRKPSSNEKFKKLYPDFKFTPLEEGLKKTCEWFEKAYPNIRGI